MQPPDATGECPPDTSAPTILGCPTACIVGADVSGGHSPVGFHTCSSASLKCLVPCDRPGGMASQADPQTTSPTAKTSNTPVTTATSVTSVTSVASVTNNTTAIGDTSITTAITDTTATTVTSDATVTTSPNPKALEPEKAPIRTIHSISCRAP